MWSIELAIKKIREFEELSQLEFSERIGYSPALLSQVESKKKNPSEKLINAICQAFSINPAWLMTGKGQPYNDKGKSKELIIQTKRPSTQKTLLAISASTAWIAPLFSVGIAAGVAVEAVINKMQKLYKAKNATELAKKLEIERSTITRWVQSNKIPDKYIKQVSEKFHIPEVYLSIDDNLMESFIDAMVEFTEEQLGIFKEKDVSKEEIRKNFLKNFGLEAWAKKNFQIHDEQHHD